MAILKNNQMVTIYEPDNVFFLQVLGVFMWIFRVNCSFGLSQDIPCQTVSFWFAAVWCCFLAKFLTPACVIYTVFFPFGSIWLKPPSPLAGCFPEVGFQAGFYLKGMIQKDSYNIYRAWNDQTDLCLSAACTPSMKNVCPSWIWWYPTACILNPIFVTGHVKPFLQCRCQCLLVVFSAVNVFVLTYLLPTTCLPSDLKKARKVSSVCVFTTLSLRTATYFPRLSGIFHGRRVVRCVSSRPWRRSSMRTPNIWSTTSGLRSLDDGTSRSIEMKGKNKKVKDQWIERRLNLCCEIFTSF